MTDAQIAAAFVAAPFAILTLAWSIGLALVFRKPRPAPVPVKVRKNGR